jgi:predicted ATPase/transcriptional regulator with XRE-family HTH domain
MVASPATFGDRLRRYRLAAGLTQEELAERAQVSPRAISDLERGLRSRPWRDTVQFLAEALHLSASERSELELAARRPGPAPTEPVARSGIDLGARRSNLPTPPTRLIGRDTETAHVGELLRRSDVRLVTLTGPGGIGKTQLALQGATDLLADFPGGVYFVPLAPIGEPSLVLSTIAQVLGVKESSGQPLTDTLTDALRERSLLLVLDNFEHVVAAAASVSDLLAHCPQLKLLVTSRSPLHLRGEHESPVPPLRLPDREHLPPPEQALEFSAVQLFAERARAVKPDFAVTSQNVAAVAEICRRLDGLPLAIELAAARIKVLSPADILNRLGDRLRILTGGARDLPARQQSLRNTIAWSYDMLDEGEKTLFRHLAVFTGGCTLEAAEVVCCELPIDVLDGLTSLVDHSMLQRDETRDEARFGMLETIHEYGRALLASAGEDDIIAQRHADYFLGLVEDCERQYTNAGPGSLTWDSRLEPEQANLRAALAWFRDNDPALGLRLAAGLGWYWVWHADRAEGEGWLTTFLARTPGEPTVRGRALLALATLKRDQGDLAGAQPLFEESLALAHQNGHLSHACQALYHLVVLDWGDNDPVGGHARLAEGLRLAQQGRDRQVLAFGLLLGANHASEIGAFVRAIRLFGAADTVVPGYRFELVTFERATYERSLEAARAALDPDVVASAWAEGQAMTLEQAIALALDVSGG